MEQVNADAKKCRFCGEILDPTLREVEALKQMQNNHQTIINNNNNNNNNNGINIPIPAFTSGPKSRVAYILLGLFLGGLGIHNFYAGRVGAGVGQLLISLLLGWLVFPLFIVWLWVIIELFAVTTDGNGVPFN